MPVRNSAPLGAPTWIDLATSDTDRAQQFYGAVFGWTFESAGPEYGGYINAFKDGKPVAGLMLNDPQWNSPDGWTTYFHTADIKATHRQGHRGGRGRVRRPVEPMEIPGKGWMGLLSDPTGAFFGLWQPTGHRGFEVVNGGRRAGVLPADHPRLWQGARLLPRGFRLADRGRVRQ